MGLLKKEHKNYFSVVKIVLLVLIYSCGNPIKKVLDENKIDFDKAFETYNLAKKYLIEEKDTVEAIRHYAMAAEFGYEPRQAYSSAIVYALSIGHVDTAMSLAFKMAEHGFRDIRAMDAEYFVKLKDHPKWQSLKLLIESNANAYNDKIRDVNNSKFITSDIQNFWTAYDMAYKETDYEAKRAIYINQYFEKGTVGLVDFTFSKMRDGGIDQFVEFVEAHRPYYDGIRRASLRAIQSMPKMAHYFNRIDSLIPKANFPNYYFVMGCHTSFGTVSLNGSLIGLENVIDENTPVEILPAHRQDVVAPVDFLPFVLIHELIHTYQNISDRTLLGATIVEGGADFFAELIVGEPHPKPKYRIYGEANEKQIFNEFRQNLENKDHVNWIAERDNIKKKIGWPNDLSYFIGYEIAKRYYENSIDKEKAIQDLLDVKNPHDILKKSGYEDYIDKLK